MSSNVLKIESRTILTLDKWKLLGIYSLAKIEQKKYIQCPVFTIDSVH